MTAIRHHFPINPNHSIEDQLWQAVTCPKRATINKGPHGFSTPSGVCPWCKVSRELLEQRLVEIFANRERIFQE